MDFSRCAVNRNLSLTNNCMASPQQAFKQTETVAVVAHFGVLRSDDRNRDRCDVRGIQGRATGHRSVAARGASLAEDIVSLRSADGNLLNGKRKLRVEIVHVEYVKAILW